MKAFLLAAGLGTRLRPLTDKIPKCLVPINGKPLMAYWLEMLFDSETVDSVLINTHYLPKQVESFIASSPYRQKVELAYEPVLLGTAGSILANKNFCNDGPLILVHADNCSIFDVNTFIHAHKNRPMHCPMTMMTFQTDSPSSCGIVELDEKGVVKAFYEKVENPPGTLANGAVYILEREVVEGLTPDSSDFSTQVIPRYLGRIYTYENRVYHRDIGNPESYQKAQELL